MNELVRANRSYRRFDGSFAIDKKTLVDLVGLARLSPSGQNLQPLKYMVSCDPKTNAAIFPFLAWAGKLVDWPGPAEGERPTGYIVLLGDKEVSKSFGVDHGIAAQTIMLGATRLGLGGCMIGSVNRPGLAKALGINDRYEILLVLALGKPAETVVLEELTEGGDTSYWRDGNGVHHVPKRKLADILVEAKL